jgi:hypothetical protein
MGMRSPYKVVAKRRSTLLCFSREQLWKVCADFNHDAVLKPMRKFATDRLEAFQQVVQDKVLEGAVTTKHGNALRKVLSTHHEEVK